MREITVKAVVLGILLSALLAGANAYLGLKASMTVSASIPAAVISMAILRLFKRSNILENNIVQTAASAGESLAAGVIFTLPALVLMKEWTAFPYWQTTAIAALGGMLGVLFTVPIRRALVVEAKLAFPEGVATAQVLEAGQKASAGVTWLLAGAGTGALFKIGETGLRLWKGVVEQATRAGGSVFYVGTNVAPALAAVGYIVGLNIAVLVFAGGALNWYVAIPILASGSPEEAAPASTAWTIWSTQTRYLGVGAMVIGGLWSVIRMWPSLVRGVRSGMAAWRNARDGDANTVPRTERDAPMPWVLWALVASVVPLFFLFRHVSGSSTVALVMAAIMLVAGFLFSAVASYMAGLVGSSNNPVSGVTIATILTASLLLAALGVGGAKGPPAAILIGAVVCCAAAIGGDNMQDLKTGHIVGATPWKQQVMQAVGVIAAALVIAPVLTLLLEAYGIGPRTEAHPDSLAAPQASLMASVARGVFHGGLPWGLVGVGMGIGAVVIAVDLLLERSKSGFRMPVLAVAVGLYLPLELGVAILAGGLAARVGRRGAHAPAVAHGRGLLLAAGLITGEALLGILLAVPIVLTRSGKNPLDVGLSGGPLWWPGLVLFIGVLAWLAFVGSGEDGTNREGPSPDSAV